MRHKSDKLNNRSSPKSQSISITKTFWRYIENCFARLIGDEREIKIWGNPWLPSPVLLNMSQRRELPEEAIVHNLVDETSHSCYTLLILNKIICFSSKFSHVKRQRNWVSYTLARKIKDFKGSQVWFGSSHPPKKKKHLFMYSLVSSCLTCLSLKYNNSTYLPNFTNTNLLYMCNTFCIPLYIPLNTTCHVFIFSHFKFWLFYKGN